jgi:hypothetical protein
MRYAPRLLAATLLVTNALSTPALAAPVQRARAYSPAVASFKKQTGYPRGRRGYVVDHRIPLCAGGPDAVDNLRWERVAESRVKDRYERLLCAELHRQGYRLVKR